MRNAGGSCQNIGSAALAPMPASTRPAITGSACSGAMAAMAMPMAAISSGTHRCQRRSRWRSLERPHASMNTQPATYGTALSRPTLASLATPAL
ncbi:hypothetical protein D3C79_874510 [compost metagenome]